MAMQVFQYFEAGRLALGRPMGRLTLSIAAFGSVVWMASSARAADAPAPPALALELNKLEPYDKGCRVYVVLTNATETAYQSMKLDLVLFQPDGIISRRIAIDLAPVKAAKRSVKLFDLEGLACEKVSSVLINEVIDCKADSGPVADCLSRIALSSVAGAPLTK
jgi:hypothetical protein